MPHLERRVACQILVVDPNERRSYGWNASGEEAARGLKTIVTRTLTRREGGVAVCMEQAAAGPRTRPTTRCRYGSQRLVAGLERVTAGLG